MSNVAAEIADLKAMVGVRTDSALAEALRLHKGTVSMWKKRGRVSAYIRNRADLMARHGQIVPGENLQRIGSEIALLSNRLTKMPMNAARLADELERLAARTRAIGGDL
jgi:hypothetical protein